MCIVIISGSSRKDGNSTLMATYLCDELKSKILHLTDFKIGYFDYCNGNNEDDFLPFIRDLLNYNLWILITPVYWYSMSAQTKTFIDRLSDLLKWKKNLAIDIQRVSWYVISCGSDETEVQGFFNPFRLSAEYLGINYLGDKHVWKDNRQPFTEEVLISLKDIVNTINTTSY